MALERGTADEEVVLVGGTDATNLTNCTRGYDGTTAVAHTTGDEVEHVVAAIDLQEAGDHIANTGAGVHSQLLLLDGSRAMTGALILPGDPTNALHAATKQYVDAASEARRTVGCGAMNPWSGTPNDLSGNWLLEDINPSGVAGACGVPDNWATADLKVRFTSGGWPTDETVALRGAYTDLTAETGDTSFTASSYTAFDVPQAGVGSTAWSEVTLMSGIDVSSITDIQLILMRDPTQDTLAADLTIGALILERAT